MEYKNPKVQQLFVTLTGKQDNELGLRFIEIEKYSNVGYIVKEIIKFDKEPNEDQKLLFWLEREIDSDS